MVAFGGLNLGDSGVFGASQMPPYKRRGQVVRVSRY